MKIVVKEKQMKRKKQSNILLFVSILMFGVTTVLYISSYKKGNKHFCNPEDQHSKHSEYKKEKTFYLYKKSINISFHSKAMQCSTENKIKALDRGQSKVTFFILGQNIKAYLKKMSKEKNMKTEATGYTWWHHQLKWFNKNQMIRWINRVKEEALNFIVRDVELLVKYGSCFLKTTVDYFIDIFAT